MAPPSKLVGQADMKAHPKGTPAVAPTFLAQDTATSFVKD